MQALQALQPCRALGPEAESGQGLGQARGQERVGQSALGRAATERTSCAQEQGQEQTRA